MNALDRREAAVRAAKRVVELNIARDDDFQDNAMGQIRLALDAFRQRVNAKAAAPGADPLLDALMDLTRELDASQEAVNTAAIRVLELAGASEEQRASTA